jgi:hypothetical protein
MSNYEQRMQETYAAAMGTGWAAYAGLMLLAGGAWSVIEGIALVSKNNHLAGGLFWGRPFWGVVFLIVGGVTLYGGFGLLTKIPGARAIGVLGAVASIVAQLLWAAGLSGANTTWTLVVVAIDLILLYVLVARGEGAAPKA